MILPKLDCLTLLTSRYVMLRNVMLCYVMFCYVMLCYVMLCYVMLCLPSCSAYCGISLIMIIVIVLKSALRALPCPACPFHDI